ncbi:hypothetical protein FIV34_09575 [Luteibacter pinisoli]|uniref:Molecular chaperone n=1 Tax=Luteibacter pinisoli TaxID=2589080 RepID=A0A4Y5Z4T4_9GAMM|nr:hypothetical protein [Luteibacter pinisoli]QDE39433.1 hypothetical protein FIV34_09575 [Luteibacter pinisoli]
MNLRLLVAGFAATASILVSLPASADEPVSVALAASSDPADAGKARVTVTIRNHGDVPVTLAKYMMPFDWDGHLPNNQFEVTSSTDGQTQTYQSTYDYVNPVDPGMLVQLGAHQSISGTLDLRVSYQFDTQVNNRFTVRYRLPLGIVPDEQAPDPKSPTYETDPNRPRFIYSNTLQILVDPTAPLSGPANKTSSYAVATAGSP